MGIVYKDNSMINKSAPINGRLHFHKYRKFCPEKSKDEKTPPKRKTSHHQINIVKLLNKSFDSEKTEKGIKPKAKRKMTSEVLSLEVEEQKMREVKVIESDKQLRAYYLTFKKLFFIIFQASYYLMENMFQLSAKTYQNRLVIVLCLLFQKDKKEWNSKFLETLMMVSRNLIYMASSPIQFQRRIDTVARKVIMHNWKKETIKKAFLMKEIQIQWEATVTGCYQDEQTQIFVEDQFQSIQERLCFLEIRRFLVTKLATDSFSNDLRKYAALQEIDEEMNLDFKFQFLMAEQFIFSKEQERGKFQNGKQENRCQVM